MRTRLNIEGLETRRLMTADLGFDASSDQADTVFVSESRDLGDHCVPNAIIQHDGGGRVSQGQEPTADGDDANTHRGDEPNPGQRSRTGTVDNGGRLTLNHNLQLLRR